MSLASGTRLGHYEITSAIGKGGMGEVWRAKDTKLGRDVAIKVLPEEFTRDPERLARFEREARVLASLNHPHIASIYGLDESDGIRFLAMELAEGEDLSTRIEHGAIPIEEAVPIAVQIAEALEAAHEKGIIHRDLKPANIKLSDDGQVKLLDFGLAKALDVEEGDSDLSNSPTMVRAATHAGVILGTAAYMSPEQARGKKVDKRADVWAFGVVLYEMLTGTRLFTGETVSDTLAAVLRGEVDLTLLPKNVPPNVVRLIARCIDRDAKRRLRDIGEARVSLTELGIGEAQPQASDVVIGQPRQPRGWIVATLVLLALCAGLAALRFVDRAPAAEPLALSVALPPDTSLALTGIQPGPPAVSPDGRSIAFVAEDPTGTRRLWVRELGSPIARMLEGTDSASYPFWSWDGRDIGFFANQKMKRVPAAGGSVLTISDAASGKGGAWNRDGVIVFCPSFNSPLHKVNATGGDAAPVTTLDPKRGESSHRFPQFLSDGRRFFYLARRRSDKENEIRVASLEGGIDAVVVKTERNAFAADGWFFYMRDQALVAQRFDEASASLSGEPKPIAEGVNGITGAGRVVASAAGSTLAYQVGDSSTATQLVWLDDTGRELGEVGPRGDYTAPSISPDGRRIAVQKLDASTGMNDIWIIEVASGNSERLTFESGNEFGPVWSPDGTRVAYASNARGPYDIVVKRVDGSGEAVPLVKTEDSSVWPAPQSWSVAGNLLVYTVEATGKGGVSILAVDADGGGEPKQIVEVAYRESAPRVSPDGRWMSFGGPIDSGAPGIFVVDFPAAKRRWQLTRGLRATWSQDGRRLAFVDPEMSLSVIDVRAGGVDFEWSEGKRLFRLGDSNIEVGGDRYLSRRWSVQSRRTATTLDLLLNWQKIAERK